MKLVYKNNSTHQKNAWIQKERKNKTNFLWCRDGGGSLGFCLFLLVSACSYFEENFWSDFQLFVKFERTLVSGSIIFFEFFWRTSSLDLVFHISKPSIPNSFKTIPIWVWFKTEFSSTYLWISQNCIFSS